MTNKALSGFLNNLDDLLVEVSKADPAVETNRGYIDSYKDGVIAIRGLSTLKMSEVVEIEGVGSKALVMNLEKDVAYALVLQKSNQITEGLFVTATGSTLGLPVDDSIIGRVVDAVGAPLDGKAPIKAKTTMPHENMAPDVMARKSVHEPVQTGILAIDAMVPIGRGQRELIIGDRQTGKTAVALDTIISQKGQDMICVYVSVAQRDGKLAQVIEKLKAHDAMEYTTVVSASATSSAVMQFLAPYAGVAIAEYFMQKGKHVLVVYDDLSKHAVAYREMSLLLRRPPGREAYPGDVFYLHSRLLERAAKLNEENGSGSITALPIIETQANDVSAYIPTNVISITDGQIFLQSDLFNKGVRPAIAAGVSVSRVGGAAQTKLVKKLSGSVRLDLAQYYELEAFSQFASELDEATKAKLTRGSRVVEALKQDENKPWSLYQEAVILFAASKGYLDKVELQEVHPKLQSLFALIESSHKSFIEEVDKDKALTDSIKTQLEDIVSNFFK